MLTKCLPALAVCLSVGVSAVLAEESGADGRHAGAMLGEPGNPEEATRTISIAVFDNYFDPERVDVVAGETVRFVVANEGSLVHEFNIGTAATHAEHQAMMMMMVDHGVIEIDRINRHMMNVDMGGGHVMAHDDPNSALLAPGESAEVVWVFTGASTLEFACNMPGHYDSGMVGDIAVTP